MPLHDANHAHQDFAFVLYDVARLLRTYADQKAGQFGMTRAQWAVMARLQRAEGLKQSELAELLDIQPISLTRLLDRLCANGLIERRADPEDRRANRLFLTPAAQPVLAQLGVLREDVMSTVLAGIPANNISLILKELAVARDNLRQAISRKSETVQSYG